MLVPRRRPAKSPRQARRESLRASRRATVQNQFKPIDILVEIPNLGLADGYGQSARSIANMLIEISKEENLILKVVNKRNLCKAIDRSEDFNIVKDYLINENQIGSVNIAMRYSLPRLDRYGAKRLISMTMFESDIVPPSWIEALNASELVIVPTEWGNKVFSKSIKTNVTTIPLAVDKLYYHQKLDSELVPSTDKFRFITVGNYFQPDRKRLLPLIEAFVSRFKQDDVELYVKSSWTDKGSPFTIPIDEVCAKYDNVILDTQNVDTDKLIDIYCTAHAALFPSLGEGFGLPHAESALLGRALVIANNSSMTSLSEYMPWVAKVKCKSVPADYTPQMIKNAGNWAECDMNKFMDECEKLYKFWKTDPKKYNEQIISCHRDNKLRHYISHENIKELFKIAILSELKKI